MKGSVIHLRSPSWIRWLVRAWAIDKLKEYPFVISALGLVRSYTLTPKFTAKISTARNVT